MTSLLPVGAIPEEQTLSLLDKEVARLRQVIGIDIQNAKAVSRLNEKIFREEATLSKLDRQIEAAKAADDRNAIEQAIRRTVEGRDIVTRNLISAVYRFRDAVLGGSGKRGTYLNIGH
jgi:hypothetical protein